MNDVSRLLTKILPPVPFLKGAITAPKFVLFFFVQNWILNIIKNDKNLLLCFLNLILKKKRIQSNSAFNHETNFSFVFTVKWIFKRFLNEIRKYLYFSIFLYCYKNIFGKNKPRIVKIEISFFKIRLIIFFTILNLKFLKSIFLFI